MILSVLEYESMKSELQRTVDRYGLAEVREAVDAIELCTNGFVQHKLAYGKLFNENAALQGRIDELED